MLAGNQLRSLPDEMSECRELELLRISANQLTDLPKWLISLPKLSWLAYSGNPFPWLSSSSTSVERTDGQRQEFVIEAPNIPWTEIDLKEKIGEGASGHIYRASWRSGRTDERDVAVKIFKSGTTSDGLPENEMQVQKIPNFTINCSHIK